MILRRLAPLAFMLTLAWAATENARADVTRSNELSDERTSAIVPEGPSLRQLPRRAAIDRMRLRSNSTNSVPYIEGTDVSGSELPGMLPPGGSYYDYPYCCGIHCSCDGSQY